MKPVVFLKVAAFYDYYLREFYKKNFGIRSFSYIEHQKKLLSDCFGWSDYFQKNLQSFGYSLHELIINDEVMQKKWANEEKIVYNDKNWMEDILLHQIRHYNPDVIIWETPSAYSAGLYDVMQNTSKKVLHIGHMCTLFKDLNFFNRFNLVLACSEFQQDQLGKSHISSMLFRHGFEPTILKKIPDSKRIIDVSFIGTLGSKTTIDGNAYRDHLLEFLLQETDINVWTPTRLSGANILYQNALFFYCNLKKGNFKNFWKHQSLGTNILSLQKRYPKRIHEAKYGLDMFEILSRSKITINCHNPLSSGDYPANMRLYEATGMGALLITDYKRYLPDIFEPDKEVITYKTKEECAEKIQYFLEHEKERESIARAGQKRTLEDHTWEKRICELLNIIEKYRVR